MKKLFLFSLILCLALAGSSFARTGQGVAGAVATVDATAPTTLSCTIPAAGTTVSVVYSEPVNTAGYDDDVDCNIDCDSTVDVTLSAPTGTGNTRTFTLSDTINSEASGDTNCNLDCTFGADDIIDIYSNDHGNVTSLACTNNSTQGGTVYTDCSTIGTHEFVYYGDYTADTDKGCKGASTAIDGTLSSTTVVDSASDPGTASPTSAANVLKFDGDSHTVTWPISSADIFSSSEGLLCMDIYLATSAYGIIYISRVDSNNVLWLNIGSNNTMEFRHYGSGTEVSTGTTVDTLPDTTWTNVCVRWSVTNNQVGIKIGAGSWQNDSDADSVTAYASEPTTLGLWADGMSGTIYIDNIAVDTASGL